MLKQTLYLLVILLIGFKSGFSQSFSIGTKKVGIGFGNSSRYSGIRFNYNDKYLDVVNGFNFAVFSAADISNGLSVGAIYNVDEDNNGLSFAGISNWGDRNGIAVGGVTVLSFKTNGVSISGCFSFLDKINGVCISAFVIGPTIDDAVTDRLTNVINGVAIAGYTVMAHRVNGIAIAGYNKIDEHYGLSIGVVNKTKKLQGIQFGLINYVENNPAWLRWMPLMNMHLGK